MSENNELESKPSEPELSLGVTVQELNILLSSLQELPHRIADPILKKLVQQAQAQLKQQAE